ncbi:MAG: dephospho-CoA kinase, partial [Actinobacteria bacterium]|nr:dephospho-CoA kinase [Actinomycetota bacterium]
EEGFNQVVAEFGDEILTNGAIDRGKLAEIIFNDSSKRDLLEEITHPLIAQRFLRIKKSLPENAVVVYEIPLLAEKPERARDFDFIVTIETSQELRF